MHSSSFIDLQKIIVSFFLSFCLFGFSSCGHREIAAEEPDIQECLIRFEIQTGGQSKGKQSRISKTEAAGVEEAYLNAYIFKESADGMVALVENASDQWQNIGEEEYVLTKKLQVGKYYFSVLSGVRCVGSYEEGNTEEYSYVVQDFQKTSLNDVIFEVCQPFDTQHQTLKDCVPFYLEDKKGTLLNEINLHVNTNHVFQSDLINALSKVDVLVIKAMKTDEGYVPLAEDPFGEKIASMDIEISGLNNRCDMKDNAFYKNADAPTTYIGHFDSSDFISFDYERYLQDFASGTEISSLEGLANLTGAKILQGKVGYSGFYLFPSEDVSVDLTVNYQPELGMQPIRKTIGAIPLRQNFARLFVVWVVYDSFKMEYDITVTGQLSFIGEGEEGFWN